MHDPMTVAFEINWPSFTKERGRNLITIWHVDPEKDGSDDSCGWFIRARHLDPNMLDKIAKDFEFNWTHGIPTGWFDEAGDLKWSTHSIVMHMVQIVTGNMWGHWSPRQERFFRRYLWHVLRFAENSCDSAFTSINRSYGVDPRETKEDRARHAASMMYSWVARLDRPWWKHPRWHVWHWKIQIQPLLSFKRWAFSRCCKCGKGFRWGEAPCSNSWNGTGPLWFHSEKHVYHSSCCSVRDSGQAKARTEQ